MYRESLDQNTKDIGTLELGLEVFIGIIDHPQLPTTTWKLYTHNDLTHTSSSSLLLHRHFLPLSKPNMKIQLLNKPSIVQLPLPPRRIKLNLKSSQKGWNKLIHLQQTNVLPDTSSTTGPKLKHCSFHFFALTRRTVEPALGDE